MGDSNPRTIVLRLFHFSTPQLFAFVHDGKKTKGLETRMKVVPQNCIAHR